MAQNNEVEKLNKEIEQAGRDFLKGMAEDFKTLLAPMPKKPFYKIKHTWRVTRGGRVFEHPRDILPHNLQKVDPEALEDALLRTVLELFFLQRQLDPEKWKWKRVNQVLNDVARALAPAREEQRKVTSLSFQELQERYTKVTGDGTDD